MIRTGRTGFGATIASAVIATSAIFASPALGGIDVNSEWSAARQWNEALMHSIRLATPRPPVHARNLFHMSVAMWDSWAAYDATASQYLVCEKHTAKGKKAKHAARSEAISFAAYRVLKARFVAGNGPNIAVIQADLDELMDNLGYDKTFTSTEGDTPAAVGNRIAATVLAHFLNDGSNQAGNYAQNIGYAPINLPLVYELPGVGTVLGESTVNDPNRWQPLAFEYLVLQNGEVIGAAVQTFVCPHWRNVVPFALTAANNPNNTTPLDPGPPPAIGTATDAEFKTQVVELIEKSSQLDPNDGVTMDASPASYGDNSLGFNDGNGYAVNPVTGLPYEPQIVKRADFFRVLAEFWADGPNSETPPGHWNVIANYVSDYPGFEKRIGGTGPIVDDLEWDVKVYLALNGAVHDAAVTSWGIKGYYDGARPITMIRYMSEKGQSSFPQVDSYHPHGLPIVKGLIELITEDQVQDGEKFAHLTEPVLDIDGFPTFDKDGNQIFDNHVGDIALYCYRGQPEDQDNEIGGVGWTLAEDWITYMADNFVTPPFAGYTSGHSTFSRSAAEVLTGISGTEYFPGGMAEFHAPVGSLHIEFGPSEPVTLQWARYYDGADQAGIARLYTGIHVKADDVAGRITGSIAGQQAWDKAQLYFEGKATPILAIVGDINCNGVVDGADLGTLLLQFGPCPESSACSGDLNDDGIVDGADLGQLLLNWTI